MRERARGDDAGAVTSLASSQPQSSSFPVQSRTHTQLYHSPSRLAFSSMQIISSCLPLYFLSARLSQAGEQTTGTERLPFASGSLDAQLRKKKKSIYQNSERRFKKKIIFRVHFCIELYIHIHTYIYIHSICSSPFPVSLFEVVGEFETAARSKRKKSGNIYLEGPLPASF